MIVPLTAFVVAAPLILVASDPVRTDTVPTFDMHPTCDGSSVAISGGPDVCMRSEQSAHDELATKWAQFPAADRVRCVQLTNMTHMPSYVQVLTCLEMARDARQLRVPAERSTVGASPSTAIPPASTPSSQ